MTESGAAGAAIVRVLGPVTVQGTDGDTAIGGTLPRAFLAVLALESPRPVSVDRLTSLLWASEPPGNVKSALQQLASRARRGLSAVGLATALQAVPPGYALEVDAETVDLRLFRAGVRSAGEALRGGDLQHAVEQLDGALDLWRDEALADLVGLPLHVLLAPALDDERWRAEELRARALLDLGRAEECSSRLASVTAAAPMREHLWVLYGQALAASGRSAEALRAVRTGMAAISATLGVPPGPELARLEESLGSAGATRRSADARTFPERTPVTMGARSAVLRESLGRALANAEAAAAAATQRSAHHEAVRQWERALELLEQVSPDDDGARLRVLLGLGEAHNTVSLDVEAQRVFGEAIDVARRIDDPIGFAWAALGFCSDRIGFVSPPMHRKLLEEALDRVPSDELLVRGRLLSRLAIDRYWSGSVDETLELAERALEASTAAGDTSGRLGALYAVAFGCWTPARAERLLAVCERYHDEAVAAGDRNHELLALRWLTHTSTELGMVARGRACAEAAVELADDLGLTVQQWITRTIAASQLLVEGDLDRAEQLATDALTVGSVCEPVTSFDYVSLFTWTLAWLRGTLADIVGFVEEVATTPGVDTARRLGLALTYGELGRLDEARAILDEIDDTVAASIPDDAQWYIAFAAMAEAAAKSGHVEAARIAHDRLAPYEDRIAVNSVTATGPVAHQIGIAAWTLGDHESAIRLLRHAVDLSDRVGAPVFGARSRLALAERLALDPSHGGDGSEIAALAAAAIAASDRHGLAGIHRDAGRLLDPDLFPIAGGA